MGCFDGHPWEIGAQWGRTLAVRKSLSLRAPLRRDRDEDRVVIASPRCGNGLGVGIWIRGRGNLLLRPLWLDKPKPKTKILRCAQDDKGMRAGLKKAVPSMTESCAQDDKGRMASRSLRRARGEEKFVIASPRCGNGLGVGIWIRGRGNLPLSLREDPSLRSG